MAVPSDGSYDIVQGQEPGGFAHQRIERSVFELAEERQAVASLGLLGKR
ncbi:hypothetical protein [Rothia nasimurium]|nr:hypothetical protein [Rothia nasimurium]